MRLTAGVLFMATMIAVTSRTPASATADEQSRPTFEEHVSPILRAHCATCHRPGRSTFALLTFDDARTHGEAIVKAVESGLMPPGEAAAGRGLPPLRDSLRLTGRQITILRNWVATDMRPGNLRRVPDPPDYPMRWPLGLPDLTIALPRKLPMPASSDPRVFNVVLGLASADDRWIRAIDFAPSSSGRISHVIFFTVPGTHVIDDGDLLPGVPGLFSLDPRDSPGSRLLGADRDLLPVGVWTPGQLARVMPPDTGHKLPRWSNLVMQIHVRPSETGAIEEGDVALYMTKDEPAIELRPLQVPPSFGVAAGLRIPPNELYTLRDEFVLPVDVSVYAARGHAHDRGRSMRLSAVLPNGTEREILQLDQWDPRWTDTYFFAAPIRLPRGARVQTHIVYDNSSSNPRIAGLAPRRVTWGPTLASEIGGMTLVLTVRDPKDWEALETARAAHFQAQVLGK